MDKLIYDGKLDGTLQSMTAMLKRRISSDAIRANIREHQGAIEIVFFPKKEIDTERLSKAMGRVFVEDAGANQCRVQIACDSESPLWETDVLPRPAEEIMQDLAWSLINATEGKERADAEQQKWIGAKPDR